MDNCLESFQFYLLEYGYIYIYFIFVRTVICFGQETDIFNTELVYSYYSL